MNWFFSCHQTLPIKSFLLAPYGLQLCCQIVPAMASIYESLRVTYMHCSDVYGLAIAEILDMAVLPSGGSLLALDVQDYYSTPCAKAKLGAGFTSGMLFNLQQQDSILYA